MEALSELLGSADFDFKRLLITGAILLLGTLLLGAVGRYAFGKRSVLNNSVSSAIGILFIYGITVILNTSGTQYQDLIAPLPFVSISGDSLYLFSFRGAHYTTLCTELLNMVILSFLVNLADGWLPKGKSLLGWLFFRCMTVVLAFFLHLVVVGLFTKYLPAGIVLYAPTILLGLLVLLLLTGALKIPIGAILTTVSPLVGGLYTFFFASAIGKQITKAMLTTLILSGLVYLLNYLGCTVISFAAAALVAYVPFIIALVVIWYIVYKVF